MQEIRDIYGNTQQQFFQSLVEDKDEAAQRLNSVMDAAVPQGYEVVRRIKVGRNDSCPCGSGKKFKKCCIYKVKQV